MALDGHPRVHPTTLSLLEAQPKGHFSMFYLP